MPKNKGKGGKNRRRGKNENDPIKRELIVAEPGQTYAQVLKMLGSGNVEALCNDDQKRTCHIRGKMNKKVWINVGDIILISLRDFQNDKADIIMKYNSDEARDLKSKGHLSENLIKGETIHFGHEQTTDDILFNETDNKSEENFDEKNLNNSSFLSDNYISSNSDNEDDYDDDDNDTLSDI